MTSKKTWTDQPDVVTTCDMLGTVRVKDQCVELRKVHGSSEVYLTVGNLFGSQTIYVPTERCALEILISISNGKRELPVSASARIVPNSEKEKN
jgi:hypothetical protein